MGSVICLDDTYHIILSSIEIQFFAHLLVREFDGFLPVDPNNDVIHTGTRKGRKRRVCQSYTRKNGFERGSILTRLD